MEKTKKLTKTELIDMMYQKPIPLTGPVEINVDILEKIWDYRCAIFFSKGYMKSPDSYRFVRFQRRGSPICTKFTISKEKADEIIQKLKLVFTPALSFSSGTYRQEGFSELDLLPKKQK